MSDELTPEQAEHLLRIREKYGSGTTRADAASSGEQREVTQSSNGTPESGNRSPDQTPDRADQRGHGEVQGSSSNDGTPGSLHHQNGQHTDASYGNNSSARQSDADPTKRDPRQIAELGELDGDQTYPGPDTKNHVVKFKKRGRPPKIRPVDTLVENAKAAASSVKEAVQFVPEKAAKLSEKEINSLKDEFVESLQLYFALLDDVLAGVTKGHQNPEIWALDDAEADLLADFFMDAGKANVKAAHMVRVMVNLKRRFAAGTIIASRAFASLDYIFSQGLALPEKRGKHAVPYR